MTRAIEAARGAEALARREAERAAAARDAAEAAARGIAERRAMLDETPAWIETRAAGLAAEAEALWDTSPGDFEAVALTAAAAPRTRRERYDGLHATRDDRAGGTPERGPGGGGTGARRLAVRARLEELDASRAAATDALEQAAWAETGARRALDCAAAARHAADAKRLKA